VRLLFAGVRGSTPVSGPSYTRVGGHTSCVAVLRDGERTPALVLDAGTGLMDLTPRFGDAPFRGTILLTHLHWDHLQGLPFFRPADRDDAQVTVAMPAQGDPVEVLGRALSPPHFPIGPDGLNGTWRFVGLDEATLEIEGFEVTARAIPHKGGRTFGFRVTDGTRTFAYLPDHGPRGPDARAVGTAGACELAAGVDVLVHGAPFLASEQQLADLYGHATVDDALAIATGAHAARLVLTHHGPTRADDAVAAIARDAAARFPGALDAACDGDLFDV
jgi:phosphoribosyl 1,2-cyclic phosphodiesterase